MDKIKNNIERNELSRFQFWIMAANPCHLLTVILSSLLVLLSSFFRLFRIFRGSHSLSPLLLVSLSPCLLVSSSAHAQVPEVGGILPGGGPRGQVTRIRIDGRSLAGSSLKVSGIGVTVKSVQAAPDGNALTAELDVQASAGLGPHELRVTTPKGVSGGLRFWVDTRPNRVLEQTLAESAAPVELDGKAQEVINGRISAKAGRDRFAFNAAQGETWTFDCFADRIRSRFDPVLEITDAAGVNVKLAQSTWESDPRFAHTFARAGRYLLTVRDSEYNGGPNYTYRLLAGRGGLVTNYLPRGGQPGQTVTLTLQGANLAATSAMVTLPMDAPSSGMVWADVANGKSPDAALSGLLVPLMVSRETVQNVGDSNSVQSLPALPAILDGVFTHTPHARFAFHASPKTHIVFDLLGRRIGSRIDGAIRILDAAGKELAANDDAPDLGKDARLEFAPPADGNYTLELSNVEEVVGADCGYRLIARPVAPDFKLAIATDRLAVPIGGTIALPVTLERLGGWNGPVTVTAVNLPTGVTCAGGLIAAGKTTTELTLTAAPNTPIIASDVHIRGEASIGGKTVAQEAPAWERYEHRSIDLLLSVEFSYTRPHHLWDMLVLGVTQRTDAITATTTVSTLTLAPGASIEIPLHILREPNAKGAITLDARNLPPKVTLKASPIPDGQTDGKIILSAAPDAPIDTANIIVQAHTGNAVSLVPAITLSVAKK